MEVVLRLKVSLLIRKGKDKTLSKTFNNGSFSSSLVTGDN